MCRRLCAVDPVQRDAVEVVDGPSPRPALLHFKIQLPPWPGPRATRKEPSVDAPIAVIGWGSLIWDLEIMTPHVHGHWRHRAGPELPLEFTRISAKRRRALAVCVDLMDGVPCWTSVIVSKRATLAEARLDLARRERAPSGFIGAFCNETGQHWGRPQVVHKIAQWCRAGGWAGAVWTDLHANFTAETGKVFTVAAGHEHLQALEGNALDEAVRYIQRAPETTNTRLRRHLRDDPWWQSQVERVMG